MWLASALATGFLVVGPPPESESSGVLMSLTQLAGVVVDCLLLQNPTELAAKPVGLTTAGAIMMAVSVTGVLTLVVSCYYRVLTAPKPVGDD